MRLSAGLFACLLLLGAVAAQVDDDCVATALAASAPGEAAADAVSNAVAQTFTTSVICEDGPSLQPSNVGGLSVAVALAISEANTVGQACSADAEAAAEFSADYVTEQLENGLVEMGGDTARLAGAWLDARRDAVRRTARESPAFLNEEGCLELGALRDGLPSAVQLGAIIGDAVGQILEAVQCGTNVVEAPEECRWTNRMFVGRCVGGGGENEAPAAPEEIAPAEPKGALDADYYKCYQLPHCRSQTGVKDCGWCYISSHPNKGYGIPCKRNSEGGCQPAQPCPGEYIWEDSKLDSCGEQYSTKAAAKNDKCRSLQYCWDQVGLEGCGWCYVKGHPAGGWGLPCEQDKGGACNPVAYCPGEYYWKDADLHKYGQKCTHPCWNIRTCASQSGIEGCGWCQGTQKGFGIPCRSASGGSRCNPIQKCSGTYVWRDNRLRSFAFCI